VASAGRKAISLFKIVGKMIGAFEIIGISA
jgi:hypothetical protein